MNKLSKTEMTERKLVYSCRCVGDGRGEERHEWKNVIRRIQI